MMAEAADVLDETEVSLEVVRLLEQGYSQSQIEAMKGWSRQTARRHIAWARGYMERDKTAAPPSGAPRFSRAPVAVSQVKVVDDFKPQAKRQTTDTTGNIRRGSDLPHPDAGAWRLEEVDPNELRRMAPADLVPRMIRISPEMARAYFDFLRMGNPGWTLQALRPTGNRKPSTEGQEYLDWCVNQINFYHGSVETILNLMLTNLYVRGALLAELVLDKDARTFADIVVPDAYTARFRLEKDSRIGGDYWQLIQGSGRDAVILDRPTVKFVALDPLPGTPYGTSVIMPGLFPALFILTMLQDARRVVAQQGWPRLDIKILVEQIVAAMPEEDQQDAEKIKAVLDSAVAQVAASYSKLDPDQAWVHTDTVEFGNPIGAIGSLDGVSELFRLLERMAIRAVKSQPLLFGIEEGMSEASANRQWEVHVQGVQAIQKVAEGVLSSLFSMALQAKGILAIAEFKFEELRASEELRDAQVLFQKLENAQLMEVMGYEDHDSASVYAVKHPAKNTPIGVVGDEEDQPDDAEGGDTENPQSGNVGAGDTSDEKDPQGNDGVNKSVQHPQARQITSSHLEIAYALAARAKMEPKGEPKNTGDENVRIAQGDIAAAKRDFDYRIDPEFEGILDAEPLDNDDTNE